MEIEETIPMVTNSTSIDGSTITFNSINYSITTFVGCRKKHKEVLHQLSGIFKQGVNAILGPTGSGKSSLLDILAGRKSREDFTGQVKIDGEIPTTDYKYRVGYVVQSDMISGMLTVRENLTFSANVRLPRNVSSEEKRTTVDRVIHQLGLEKCAESRVGTEETRGISGGERRRTNIGMDLVLSPTVLFLDEPTTGVDPVSRKEFWEMLKNLKTQGITILVSTPYMDEATLCDRIALITGGKILKIDAPQNIVADFGKILWSVKGDNMHKLLTDLRENKRLASCFAFGDTHHVTLADEKYTVSELEVFLKQKGHSAIDIQTAKPNIEDCFMALGNGNSKNATR